MDNANNSFVNIINLINEHNDTPSKVLKDIGLNPNTIADWKKGKGKPSADAIVKFAQYYNVSTDYLLLGKLPDEEANTSLLQKQLNNVFNQLDEGDQRECIGFAKGLLHKKNTDLV